MVLLVNVPIALIALVCIRFGVPADRPEDRHPNPIDVVGAVSGTLTIVFALVAPSLLVEEGTASWSPWRRPRRPSRPR